MIDEPTLPLFPSPPFPIQWPKNLLPDMGTTLTLHQSLITLNFPFVSSFGFLLGLPPLKTSSVIPLSFAV